MNIADFVPYNTVAETYDLSSFDARRWIDYAIAAKIGNATYYSVAKLAELEEQGKIRKNDE